MTDDLLAYLLDDLPPRRREEVELKIQSDAEWRREYQRLRECFDASQQEFDTDCADDPPGDLVKRTCQLVDSGEFDSLHDLMDASTEKSKAGLSSEDSVAARQSRWSLSDVTIAAGVMLVLFGLLSPALLQSRDESRNHVCDARLRQVATWIAQSAENRGGLLPTVASDQPMGATAWLLSELSGIPPESVLSTFFCPNTRLADDLADGKALVFIARWPKVAEQDGRQQRLVLYYFGEMYASQPGFIDKDGDMRPRRLVFSTQRPIVGHAPRLSADNRIVELQGGCRENVVFEDCHVDSYREVEALRRDNPYLNDSGEHAASRREGDVILLRGDVTPSGLRQGLAEEAHASQLNFAEFVSAELDD